MATITFDTHKFIQTLQEAGFDQKQAEAVNRALSQALSESTSLTLATKQDMSDLRIEIRDVRTEIERSKYDLIKWVAGLLIAQAALVATLVKLL